MSRRFLTIFFLVIVSFISRVLAVEELDNVSPEYLTKTYEKALASFNQGKYEESLNHIRHVIKSSMRDYRLRYLAAHNHWKQRNYNSAEIHFATAISVAPDQASGYIDLSLLYLEQKKWLLALNQSSRGIRVLTANNKPVPAKLYNIEARVHLYRGDFAQALAQAQAAKVAHLKYPKEQQKSSSVIKDRLESIILEGRAQVGLKQFDEADLAFSWAAKLSLKLQDENPYLDNLTGYYYESRAASVNGTEKKSYLDKAIEYYEKALKSDTATASLKQKISTNLARVKPQ